MKKPKVNFNYFKRLIDSDDPASVKRFLGLLWSLFLMVAAPVVLFIKAPIANQKLMHEILLYGFAIVFVAILGVSLQEFALIGVKREQIRADAAPDVTVENADSVTTTKADTANIDTANVVNTASANIKNNEPSNAK